MERCSAFLHVIDINAENLKKEYETIRNELKLYDEKLMNKPEVVALTKIDTLDEKTVQKICKKFEKAIGKKVYAISSVAKNGLFDCLIDINQYINRRRKIENNQTTVTENKPWSPI